MDLIHHPIQVGVAWWLYIDAMIYGSSVTDSTTGKILGYSWVPGLGLNIAFVMVNGLNWEQLSEENAMMFHGSNNTAKARCFLMFAIMLSFMSMGGALAIMIGEFVQQDAAPPEGSYPGIAIFVQCLLTFVATFVMRVGTVNND